MRILLLADLHFGAIKDAKYVKSIWDDIILKEIISNKTDLVVILGDYFDRLFATNDDLISLPIECMDTLVRACKNTKIRIIYGTESHEMNQYNLFNHFMNHGDIRIIRHHCEETINGKSILYLPEEYVQDKQIEYADTLYAKKYDYIFGHGIIVEGMPPIVGMSKPKSKEKQVPRFKVKELSEHSKITVFGHYHIHTDIDNVHYVGSLFRWKFGEDTPKGYTIIEDCEFKFIENKEAWPFITYEFQDDDVSTISQKIAKIKEKHADIFESGHGKIRFIFKSDNPSFYENLRTTLMQDKMISSMIKTEVETRVETDDGLEDEFEFVLDKSIPPIDKISRLIHITKGFDFNNELLQQYLYGEIEL